MNVGPYQFALMGEGLENDKTTNDDRKGANVNRGTADYLPTLKYIRTRGVL